MKPNEQAPKYRRVKLRVLSKAHSAAFQRAVFEDGGAWNVSRSQTVKWTDTKFLFVDEYGHLSWSDDEAHFNKNNYTEITFPEPEARMEITDDDRALLERIRAAHEAGEPITLEPPEKVWTVPEGKFYLDMYGDVERGGCADIDQLYYGNSYATTEHAEIVRRKVATVQIIYAWIFDHYPDYREPEIGDGSACYPLFFGGGKMRFVRRDLCREPAPGMSEEIFNHFQREYEAGRIPQLTKLVEGE